MKNKGLLKQEALEETHGYRMLPSGLSVIKSSLAGYKNMQLHHNPAGLESEYP